jgi:hypothetical protein
MHSARSIVGDHLLKLEMYVVFLLHGAGASGNAPKNKTRLRSHWVAMCEASSLNTTSHL